MRRFTIALAVAAAAFFAAAPAWAHEEINPKTLPTGVPTFFTLSAANEKTTDLVKIVVTAPKGVPLGSSTKEPAGWTVTKTDTAATWVANAGVGVKSDHFDQWGFETDGADQPGSASFKITLTYADKTSDDVEVPVTVTAAGAASATTITTTAGATATTPTTSATEAASVAKPSQGRATAALIVAIVAAVAALAALGAALARRRPSSASTGGGDTQDF